MIKKCVKEKKARARARVTQREKTEVDACAAIRIQSVNDFKNYNPSLYTLDRNKEVKINRI